MADPGFQHATAEWEAAMYNDVCMPTSIREILPQIFQATDSACGLAASVGFTLADRIYGPRKD